ncbi:MAG: SDR family oxidoreductase [Trueperaceae bacterium]|nr:MAG: SDR family oxidoreductase [Trueperaceae bacterium]
MSKLAGRTALVTGAGRGIGYQLMLALEAAGIRVAALDLEPPEPKSGRLTLTTDITDPSAVERAIEAGLERFGSLDILINNAAVTDLSHHQLTDIPLETWRQVFEVNVTGAVIVTRAVLPTMRSRGSGNIVFITSSLGLFQQGIAGDAVYSASKAAVEALAFVLSLELAGSGVNVNTLYPSVKVDTGFFAHLSKAERRTLARPTLLNEPALFLAGLAPGALSGVSVSQESWDCTPGYADALRVRALQHSPPG